MELDAFKQIINQQLSAAPRQHSAADLAGLLGRRTVSVVQKLRNSLYLELGITLLFTGCCITALLLVDDWVYTRFLRGCTGIGVLVAALLAGMIGRTRVPHNTYPVKQNLETIGKLIRQYQRLYLWLGTGLVPFCIAFAFWLSYQRPDAEAKPVRWDLLPWLMAGAIVASAASFYFTRWYLGKLYNNYLAELDGLKKEFQEAE